MMLSVFLGECLTKIKREKALVCIINTAKEDAMDQSSEKILPMDSEDVKKKVRIKVKKNS